MFVFLIRKEASRDLDDVLFEALAEPAGGYEPPIWRDGRPAAEEFRELARRFRREKARRKGSPRPAEARRRPGG
jgi:hypothetical protein